MSYNINLPFFVFVFVFPPFALDFWKKNKEDVSPFSPQVKARQLSLYFYSKGKVESGIICFSDAPCVHACTHTGTCALSHTHTHKQKKKVRP